MIRPIVAIVGRPNVGKSTLFNRLIGRRQSLVRDVPGVTRDRLYGTVAFERWQATVVDTGGFEPSPTSDVMAAMRQQVLRAIEEADCLVFVVDAREGVTPVEEAIAAILRRSRHPVIIAANKVDSAAQEPQVSDCYRLGFTPVVPISAEHGRGVAELLERVRDLAPSPAVEDAPRGTRVAIVGRPNVGKSTFVNAVLGEERMIAFDEPGTTRDAISLDFARGGQKYTIIDTAGIRRQGKRFEAIEKFSVIKTLQAIEDANVVVLLLDAEHAITEQDAHLAGHILDAGRALVVAINKWDAADADAREQAKRDLERKMGFLSFATHHFISARDGKGVGPVLKSVREAFASAMIKLPTPRLTRTLQLAVERQQPPRAGLVRPKLRYAHQGGVNPPLIVVHGTALRHVPDAYRRYLERFFSEAFQLRGTPLRIQFKVGANPYA